MRGCALLTEITLIHVISSITLFHSIKKAFVLQFLVKLYICMNSSTSFEHFKCLKHKPLGEIQVSRLVKSAAL